MRGFMNWIDIMFVGKMWQRICNLSLAGMDVIAELGCIEGQSAGYLVDQRD
jgi:hypothetical protein